ncbi:MAG: PSD1 and planctomycete cytochrome C domain-containing protein [Pirellulaceae bacterium]|nr:PSD1 and planctomycete cytochrome C domain-containing protein [Pirellulaceae bacterium]
MVFSIALTIAGAGPFLAIAVAQPTFTQDETNFFENKIRPVLVEHCYECHSVAAADAGKLKGGLRLDNREAVRQGGDTGPAVVAGNPEESLLLSALHYQDYEMPPSGKLPDAIIADFKQWIDMGAPDPRDGPVVSARRVIDFEQGRLFWSFQPLKARADESPTTPLADSIDRFVQKKQQELGLTMSPMASPRILVRRAWLDLLGIPPQPEEVADWTSRLSETTDGESLNQQVWSQLLDHLLSRPEYGERWARHWMDIARFAESTGYEHDSDRPNAYHYRDFLIKAFNSDLPYDQFVQWQIAGDQIEPENPLAWMATGFLGAGVFPSQLTETEFEKTRYDELDDMVSTAGVAFLGLSVGCARCHDHKFDPLTSEDYYRLVATFARTIRAEKELNLDPANNEQRQFEFARKLESAKKDVAAFVKSELPVEFRAWLAATNLHEVGAKWDVLTGEISSSDQTTYTRLNDGSYLAGGVAPNQEVVTFMAPVHGNFKSLRIEALADDSLPNRGPGRAGNGNFALIRLNASVFKEDGTTQEVELQSPRATFEQNSTSLAVAAALDNDPNSGWAVDGQIGRDHAAVFDLVSRPNLKDDSRLKIELVFRHPNARHSIGRVRFSVSNAPNAVAEIGEIGTPEHVRQALLKLKSMTPEGLQLAERVDSTDWSQALEWFKSQSTGYQDLSAKVADIDRAGPGLQLSKVLGSGDGLPRLPHHADDRGYPHFYPDTYLLRRGDVEQKVSLVTADVPQVLRKTANPARDVSDAGVNEPVTGSRQRLATWLTAPELGSGALAARVMSNRLWQHHFGTGIVATPNDFGEMGERPSNPELLEGLATELVDKGWRLKPLHKAIMTSQTYLQGHRLPNDPRSKIDPDNLYLWHRAPRRLEAEAIRDSMLVAAGQLDATMYGPGSLDPNMKRRSLYFVVKRSQLIPSMMLFDWPEHLVSIGQRQATTVAPQALLFMNSPQGRAYAESFARRVISDQFEVSVTNASLIAYGRPPTDRELQLSLEYLTATEQQRTSRGDVEARLMAVADFCQILMSANEFIYVD